MRPSTALPRKVLLTALSAMNSHANALMPTANGANIYPHNTKLYNLCTMQRIGVQEWCKISEDIKNKYFTTEFEIGKGAIDPK